MTTKSSFSSSTSKSYALALYELAKESSLLVKIEEEIKMLNTILNDISDFREVILNPTISKQEKGKIMYSISEKNNFSEILKNFLGFLATKNRLFFFV